MLLKSVSLAAACVLGFVLPANAHHSHAMYDPAKRMTVTGTVKEYIWSNPHVWVYVMAPNESGEVVEWLLESGSPAALARGGWAADSMQPGDEITVTFGPLKDGSYGGLLGTIELPNGQVVSSGALRNNIDVSDEEVVER